LSRPKASSDDTPFETFGFNILDWKPQGPHDDRAKALILGTVLEQGLETAISTKLIPLSSEEERYIFEGFKPA
jgi:hypothetical protein